MIDLKIKKGDIVICSHPRLSHPSKGIIIALTDEPGKMIGIELTEQVGFHSCDGRGRDKHCVWARPEHIMTQEEYSSNIRVKEESLRKYQEFEELVLRRN